MHIGLGFCTHQALPKSKALAQLAQKYEIFCCKLTASMLFRAKMLHKGYLRLREAFARLQTRARKNTKHLMNAIFYLIFKIIETKILHTQRQKHTCEI